MLNNWAVACDGDMELVDGYDSLPGEYQVKVKRAIQQKHVDDKDWNGVCTYFPYLTL